MTTMKVQSPPSLTPLPRLQSSAPLRANTPEEISVEFVDAREQAREEPPELKGVLYQQSDSGAVRVLKYSGQTTDELPPDIPASAVRDNRVVIYVDGIHQEMGEQQRQIRYFLHGHAPTGADVQQDVIGVHEGAGKSGFRDGVRIAQVLSLLKLVQLGAVPLEWAQKKIFTIDPAVKTVHDQVKQSLLAGRDVQLMTHSGGGAETAAALTLLKRGGMGKQIAENVRLLSLASAASHKDFMKAGLKADNVFYTGSKNDPVHYMFENYVSPLAPLSTLCFAAGVVRYALGWVSKPDPNGLSYHAPDYIFAKNADAGPRIQAFLDGAPGGIYSLP
jgi:hypothetical protein